MSEELDVTPRIQVTETGVAWILVGSLVLSPSEARDVGMRLLVLAKRVERGLSSEEVKRVERFNPQVGSDVVPAARCRHCGCFLSRGLCPDRCPRRGSLGLD